MIQVQNTVINHKPNLFHFWAQMPSWIDVIKSPHQLKFLEIFFIAMMVAEKIIVYERTPGTNRVNTSYERLCLST